ncbi:MAG: hypothetical protein RMJ06_06650 [Nitrososphaerota archaeon]|nr:hypothetical protein [Nitrososphaerota archaeon]
MNAKFSSFSTVLSSMKLFVMEGKKGKGGKGDRGEILSWIESRSILYNKYYNKFSFYWRLGAPISILLADKLTEIIEEVLNRSIRDGIIPPDVLSEVIETEKRETVIKLEGRQMIK